MKWSDIVMEQDEYEPDYKLLGDDQHCARKMHTCDDCGGLITPGQYYRLVRALDEGEFKVTKWHIDKEQCRAAHEDLLDWEHQMHEIMGDILRQEWVLEHAEDCKACNGWGSDSDGYDWEPCGLCGGHGKWDSGEVMPDAFLAECTEPRIPLDLMNIYIPSPRPVRKSIQYAQVLSTLDELPF